MARPREFESDAVMDGVMRVFWAQGYEATSLDDLCAATGLNRSSLYASFGDKRALLLMSIERYIELGSSRIVSTLAQPIPIRQAMAQMMANLVDSVVAGPGRTGCFIGNCAIELARHDKQALQLARKGMQKFELVLFTAFTRAQEQGELRRDVDVAALARFFMSSMQGLRLVGKVNPDRSTLEDITATMLRLLE
jgi:TetR/AcrR family transcriptional regulator, transcriptional repressor for nem operon